MAQAVAHFIGNEEVTGPSPVVSFFSGLILFFRINPFFIHTPTQRKYTVEIRREYYTGSSFPVGT